MSECRTAEFGSQLTLSKWLCYNQRGRGLRGVRRCLPTWVTIGGGFQSACFHRLPPPLTAVGQVDVPLFILPDVLSLAGRDICPGSGCTRTP